jgi:hypothetical protein
MQENASALRSSRDDGRNGARQVKHALMRLVLPLRI